MTGESMRRHLIIGQLICLAGLLLLLVFVPFTPSVTGLPRHRVTEMCIFWIGQWMLMIGMGFTLRASATRQGLPVTQGRNLVLAAIGVLIAVAMCFISLSNLTFSSIQGAGLRMPGLHWGRLFPRELGYLLGIPLLLSFCLQMPILVSVGSVTKNGTNAAEKLPRRPARAALRILLVILLAMFGMTILLFMMDRWFAVASVVISWIATIVFFCVGIEQVAAAKSKGLVLQSDDHRG